MRRPVINSRDASASRLNDFARRSFRDTADQDYVAARIAFRAHLWTPFQWAALQAIEKYLKGILLFNRVRAKKVYHDLEKGLSKTDDLPFEFQISDLARQTIKAFNRVARFRYMEASYVVRGSDLVNLDRTVYEIRAYCRALPSTDETAEGVTRRDLYIAEMQTALEQVPHYRIPGGFLEKVLETENHAARAQLVWQNLYFGTRRRQKVRMHSGWQAVNAPLFNYPRLLDEVERYVYLPKEVVSAYRELQAEREIGVTEAKASRDGS